MNCLYCNGICIKKGIYKNSQKYKCKSCLRHQRSGYKNLKYTDHTDDQIVLLNSEGVGTSSISRISSIPKTSVQRRIYHLGCKKKAPVFIEKRQSYEVDELYTYIGNKTRPCYVMYAINRKTRQIIDYICGFRNKENIGKLIGKLLSLSPRRIYTDRLTLFASLIPAKIHSTFQYRTNYIERKNLTLRTHLKRLSRKTICYSKSIAMLDACFRLYAWR